jgi:nucleotide-binding universal stress UspA family protein
MRQKLIIAATDFSANADQAVQRALALARRRGAELIIVHVIPPVVNNSPLMDKLVKGEAETTINDLAGRLGKLSQEELQSRYLSKNGDDRVQALCLEGKASGAILKLVKERDADLLVIGATGAMGLAGSLFGASAGKLLRKAPCSVLVVRAQETGDAKS